ncbi:ISAs1 family transposase [bacterium]|nr:ISAs1 family transposase [bacterium]
MTTVSAAIATKQKASELRSVFAEVEDPRSRTPVHDLIDMIFIAVCAAICGCDSWTDVESFGKQKIGWLRKFLSLENGIPSHDTFSRVFGALNDDQMCQALTRWLTLLGKTTDGQHIAIDGKSFRRSFDNSCGEDMLHLVNAWSTKHGICFGQQAVDKESNEITAVPKLLDLMKINGAKITLDAMHCQHATAQQIIDRGADYVIAIKANQLNLVAQVQQAFLDAEESDEAAKTARLRTQVEQPEKSNKKQGRTNRIKRYCAVMPVPKNMRGSFPGIRSIVRMYREQERPQRDGTLKETEKVSFFVSSLQPTVRDHAKLIRDHWKVENQLHWTLDMTFSEDQRRNRKNNGAAIAGFINRLALSILQQDTSIKKTSLRCKRKVCGWNSDALENVLNNFSR